MAFFSGTFKPGAILKVEEHHETYYYDVSSLGKMQELCLFLLSWRLKNNYYDADDRPDPFCFGMNKEDIEKLPKNTRAKETLFVDFDVYEKEMRDYKVSLDFLKKVKLILKNKDGEGARKIIEERSDKAYTDEYIGLLRLTKT